MQNFFSYPIVVDELSQFEKRYRLKAGPEELEYLAEVLKVPAVKSLEAEVMLKLKHKENHLDVWGNITAELELQSVVSLENFTKIYKPEFSLVYDTKMTYKELREIDEDIDDEIPDIIEDGKIDLAQIVIEQVALVMEDYPRKDGEVFAFVAEFDEETSQTQNPFNVLAKLKK